MIINRRHFINKTILGTGAILASLPGYSKTVENPKIACQQYTWLTYFQRENKNWLEDRSASWRSYLASGLKGYEPSFNDPSEVKQLQRDLAQHGLWSTSMYVNSTLHEEEHVEESISQILSIAREARKMGIKILVTNPVPIRWGGTENKTDEQLIIQANALNELGEKLKTFDIALAYHNHDAEMRESAREFHHMLTGTNPENVKLCLDAHWIFRGSGNSQVALFDIVELYADRIIELHLRQSKDGIWSETFGDGDIDYNRLAAGLSKKNIYPHLVLEQAIEAGTPHTMNTEQAIKTSLQYIQKVFVHY